ncbi:radical SAM protein [Parerythrobacter aestuarii]|uniref:radical SAM protein n=1 Tax=Parerythrobacter aestuarii TaxID=3020909 RepID=UPI0024DE6DEF|nr:radical SAM protein [Parerythrobacter aestuarii]
MWHYYPDLLAKPVPRYTSYPTAAEFGELPAASYRSALESVEGEVSLYLHIPFCEKICFYCGCNTGKANRRARLESYLASLTMEIASVAASLPHGTKVRRVSFGGGSPNAITPDDFRALVAQIFRRFELDDPVWSIELDPRTMTAGWADALGEVGVQRASMGVQTFAPQCQSAIGREQPEQLIAQTTAWLRSAGVSSINFDLMYGLPGQERIDLLDTLVRTLALGADRVALFGYAHVPHIVPRQRVIDTTALPDQHERFAMAELGYDFFAGQGYQPVGFDHFARLDDPLAQSVVQGTLHRNFQGFTDDTAVNLIGLGSSAISSFPALLAQNEKNSGRYRMKTSRGAFATSAGLHRSIDDRERGKAIEDLLCFGSVRLPAHIAGSIACPLAPFIARGLARLEGDVLTIAAEGLPYTRTIAALIDSYRDPAERRFSAAV